MLLFKKRLMILLGVLFFFGCALDEPKIDNPLDPENPDYEPPSVIITSAPDSIHTSSMATFTWQGEGTAYEFMYRLMDDEGTPWPDSTWRGWTTNTSGIYEYLNETGYTFEIKAKSEAGVVEEDSLKIYNFTVDAVDTNSIIFYPRRQEAAEGSTVTFEIRAEEVGGLTGVEFSIDFDTLLVKFNSASPGQVLLDADENIFIDIYDGESNTLTISTFLLDANNSTFSGTGGLAEIEIVVLDSTTLVFVNGSVKFRDNLNNTISVNDTIGGRIDVLP